MAVEKSVEIILHVLYTVGSVVSKLSLLMVIALLLILL